MPIASLVDQNKAAVAKARALNERPIDPIKPDSGWQEAENVLRDIKDNFVDLGKGVVAGNVGSAVDLTAMATLVGYQGLNWAKGGSFNGLSEALLTPGGTDSIGKDALNADIEGFPFIAGSMLSPSGVAKGLTTSAKVVGVLPALKAMFVGARVQTEALTGTLKSARSLRELGTPLNEIWRKTGWYPDSVDKAGKVKWKYVLSDADSVTNGTAIQKKAESLNLEVGSESIVSLKLSEAFLHPTLFDAYPQLRDVPIDIFVKRVEDVEGVVQFKIYNQSMAEKGISGGVSTTGLGRKTVNLTVDADKDLGRSTILHEVQHLVQTIEGFDEGSSVLKWEGVVLDAQNARVNKILLEDMVSGKVDIDMLDEEFLGYVDTVAAKTRAAPKDILERLDQFMVRAVEGEVDMAAVAASEAVRTKRDLRMMLEAMADTALDAGERADFIIKSMPFNDINKLVRSRYWRQGGEVEARLTQHLRDTRQEQLLAGSKPPQSREVSPGRQIRGDEIDPNTGL